MGGPQRVVGLKAVVEAGADLGILAGKPGFLLDEAGQVDDIVNGGALGGDGIGQGGGLVGKLAVQSVDVVIDVLIRIDVVGLGVEVALALHQAAIVRDLVPEIVLAEIGPVGAVGAAEEGIHIVDQPGIDKDLGHADGGGALGDRDVGGGAAHDLGDGLDDIVIAHAGAQRKVAVLDAVGLAAVFDVLFEQPVMLDDALVLELGGNAADRGALCDGHGLLGAQIGAAVDLVIELQALVRAKAKQRQDDDNDQAPHGEAAAVGFVLFVVLLFIFGLGFRLAAGLGGFGLRLFRGRGRLRLGLRRGGGLRGLPAGTADFHKRSLFCL